MGTSNDIVELGPSFEQVVQLFVVNFSTHCNELLDRTVSERIR